MKKSHSVSGRSSLNAWKSLLCSEKRIGRVAARKFDYGGVTSVLGQCAKNVPQIRANSEEAGGKPTVPSRSLAHGCEVDVRGGRVAFIQRGAPTSSGMSGMTVTSLRSKFIGATPQGRAEEMRARVLRSSSAGVP